MNQILSLDKRKLNNIGYTTYGNLYCALLHKITMRVHFFNYQALDIYIDSHKFYYMAIIHMATWRDRTRFFLPYDR